MTDRWWLRAACRGRPTDWWFPKRGEVFVGQVARSICVSCVVRRQCLEAALAEELATETIPYGIRGAATAEQRIVMIRTRRRAEATAS